MKKRLKKKVKWYNNYQNIKQKKSFFQYGYRSRFNLYDLLEKIFKDTSLSDFNILDNFDIIKIK